MFMGGQHCSYYLNLCNCKCYYNTHENVTSQDYLIIKEVYNGINILHFPTYPRYASVPVPAAAAVNPVGCRKTVAPVGQATG